MSRLPGSLRAMISLGPSGPTAFLRESRPVERVGARVRAKFKGARDGDRIARPISVRRL
jgi:hypothetical protein